jgi:uncharacterized membrane protein YbhN (UPF0104 family)
VNVRKALSLLGTTLILLLVVYFYASEVVSNWASLRNFQPIFKLHYLLLSLGLYLVSYLLEIYVWQHAINTHGSLHQLTFAQSIAVVNASGFLKYVPGRIWTYTAQMTWLKKYGISKPAVLYVNLLCIVGSVFVSLYLGLGYLAIYTHLMSRAVVGIAFASLVLLNLAYVKWNAQVVNYLIGWVARLFRREIVPLQHSSSLIVLIQAIYACSWAVLGFGAYFLAEGIGLKIPLTDIFALLAAISLSWLAGYMAVITPGGLGVREAVMLSMLNSVVSPQTAIIFPILARLMYSVAEVLMGIMALWLGLKYKVFSAVGAIESS